MANIESSTVVIFTYSVSILMGFYMLLLKVTASGIKGIKQWVLTSFLIAIPIFFQFTNFKNEYTIEYIKSITTVTGLYIYLYGIWLFKEKNINKLIVFGIPILNIILQTIFTYILGLPIISLTISSLFILIYSCIALYEMLSLEGDQKYLKRIFLLNAVSFLFFALILIYRLYNIILLKASFKAITSDGEMIALIISAGIMTTLTFGFILAVNQRLHYELKKQLDMKNKLFSIIAHDLKGPVGTIVNFLDLLNREKDIDEHSRQKYLKSLEELSQSTYRLLQNLLDWSRGEQNGTQLKPLDLNQLILENVSLFKQLTAYKSVDLKYTAISLPKVLGNEKMINTVIRNVISNALKFTPRDGQISIVSKVMNSIIQLKITDTGLGISQEKLKSIFILEQNHSSIGTEGEIGSGLGLPICKDFIQKNKGKIRIESELDKGTSIIIELPINQ